MAGSSKRRSRQSPPAKTRSKPVDNEWEKEDEELELEAQLFGRSKKRAKPDPGPSSLQNGDLVDDDDVASQDEFDDVGIVKTLRLATADNSKIVVRSRCAVSRRAAS